MHTRPSARRDTLPALLLSLQSLDLQPSEPIGAPAGKRCAGPSVRLNSANHSVSEILLARLLLTSNDEQLHTTVRSEYGVALLHELQSIARIACLGTGASGSLTASHIAQVFRATGSNIAQAGPYAAIGLGIESALPHDVASRVFRELIASVTAVRTQPIGVAMEACLVTQGSSSSASI